MAALQKIAVSIDLKINTLLLFLSKGWVWLQILPVSIWSPDVLKCLIEDASSFEEFLSLKLNFNNNLFVSLSNNSEESLIELTIY